MQKCNLKNEFLLRPIGFVLVGYMGDVTFLGLLAMQWECAIDGSFMGRPMEMFLITFCENY